MDKIINNIFKLFDDNFYKEKVETNSDGSYGLRYEGLVFDYYFSDSIYSIDYLSVEDYFESLGNVTYNERELLGVQYLNLSIDKRLSIVGIILTLLNVSTYNKGPSEIIIKKALNYLERNGLQVQFENNVYNILTEIKLFNGSYCDILSCGVFYKKKLKTLYQSQESWRKRFKYEYENMVKLSSSPYVLKVFDYDGINNTYLMEICDCNLYQYITTNTSISEGELINIIYELIKGMIDVHNGGIIHRDLHLGNILIKNKNIILCDFGLSKDTTLEHSLKSTSTPKNSHYFMDSIGFSDFTKLDELSDIYSVGKIIDYITKDTILNDKLSYVINKATERDRTKRYDNFNNMEIDIKNTLRDLTEIEIIKSVEKNIADGLNSPKVEEFIMKLSKESNIAKYIVEKKSFNFWQILIDLSETKQDKLLSNILDNYTNATGYGNFHNYDLFACIMFDYIKHTKNSRLQSIAYSILVGCSEYRYNAKEQLDEINVVYPYLKNK